MGTKELEKAEQQGLLEFFKLTGKIRKHDTPEEILEAFYPMRLAYYQKRNVRPRMLTFMLLKHMF